ncbi:hypothetical protein Agabi119p4_3162 [Agaricus bisporus var. burnettii]|uniref:ADF-H domain-containing protein n=1 Tax=Agaricus bisporus var. burnettii TaxID=192524 RepID=A0A8H7F6J5_AGABI|nr:hypothetical protein Agabi119p4_3162 [Agaricus bisporus var. burnettii]
MNPSSSIDPSILRHPYVLAKLDPPSTDWTAFFFVPDTAQVRDKMLYASSRSSLLKSLGSTVFTDSIFATSKADLTADAYQAHLRHLAAPKPLSAREQEMADVRAAESSSASYEGSRARTSHVGPVGFKRVPELEQAILELVQGNDSSLLVMTIDPQTETLLLKSNSEIAVGQLASAIPRDEPTYALFAWAQSHTSPPRREIVFIYSCPSSSPIRHRMLYSSGSGATLHWIKEMVASSAPAVQIASRKIETSDPQELTEEYIIEELRLKVGGAHVGNNGNGSSSTPNDAQPFAKPRGPSKRR